jgi:Ca2+-binding RTX toxin-like protein
MAFSKAANDKTSIRHDTGSLFGGLGIRDFNDTQVVTGENGVLYYTSINSRVVYKPVSDSYRGAGLKGIDVRSAWEGAFPEGSEGSPTDDFVLDWGRARFNAISLQLWDETKETWVTSFSYSETRGPGYALPNRGTSDVEILNELKNFITTSATATYAVNYYNNWEYQCALFNWQYPEGSSYIQYLFGNDTLNGTRKDDFINGGAGNDVINGGLGNDVLNGSFGQDTLYGDAGNDVIVFSGGSNVWDYTAVSATVGARGAYKNGIDMAAGGSGKDYFVFELPVSNFHGGESYYPTMPDLYGNATTLTPAGNYNPFLSQSQNATAFSADLKSYNVSPLTFRTRILDFKVGEDKLDLSNFGIDQDLMINKLLTKLSGSAFVTALNTALKPDGIQMIVGKNGWTSNNTTLFIQEVVDTNGNSKTNDTLLEIQLVGISSAAISMKIFGDALAL